MLKDIFRVQRPFAPGIWRAPVHDSTGLLDFTMPSCHSANSVANSLIIAHLLVTRRGPSSAPAAPPRGLGPASAAGLAAGVALWIGAISSGRVYLGVHYPSDVRAGLALGLGLSAVYIRLLPWMQHCLRVPAVPTCGADLRAGSDRKTRRRLVLAGLLAVALAYALVYPRRQRLGGPSYLQVRAWRGGGSGERCVCVCGWVSVWVWEYVCEGSGRTVASSCRIATDDRCPPPTKSRLHRLRARRP